MEHTWYEMQDNYNLEICGRCGVAVETNHFLDEHNNFHAQIDALSNKS